MWDVVGDLMFEKENFSKTIQYCKHHNHFIRNNSAAEIERMFWGKLVDHVGTFTTGELVKVEEQMIPIFNACFVISVTPKGATFPMVGEKKPQQHMITFFVRLGRDPAVDLIK